MALIDYFNYDEYVTDCKEEGLDDDYILPPEKFCKLCSFYNLIWHSWFDNID